MPVKNPTLSELVPGAPIQVMANTLRGWKVHPDRCNIRSVSKTMKVITVTREKDGRTWEQRYYRRGNSQEWIFEPGTGAFGAMLNDRFTLSL